MKLRKLSEQDKPFLAELIAMEPTHTHTPDFYFEPRSNAFVLEDDGGPTLPFVIRKVLRVNCDFDKRCRLRSAKALASGITWLMDKAAKSGFTEVVFETQSPEIRAICERRFGFKNAPNEMRRYL